MRPCVFLVATLLTAGCGGTELSTESIPDAGGALEAASMYDATAEARIDAGSVATPCIPGQSVACVGLGGCSSNQVCSDAGTALGPCDCVEPVEASTPAEASTSPETGTTPLCVPGQSVACAGPGGCISNQVCNAQGSGYGACDCASDGAALLCVPGQSIECGGPGGCFSSQVCNSDGNAYGPCVCPGDGGTTECETANDCETLLGPLPPICEGSCCLHYICLYGICQTTYCG